MFGYAEICATDHITSTHGWIVASSLISRQFGLVRFVRMRGTQFRFSSFDMVAWKPHVCGTQIWPTCRKNGCSK